LDQKEILENQVEMGRKDRKVNEDSQEQEEHLAIPFMENQEKMVQLECQEKKVTQEDQVFQVVLVYLVKKVILEVDALTVCQAYQVVRVIVEMMAEMVI